MHDKINRVRSATGYLSKIAIFAVLITLVTMACRHNPPEPSLIRLQSSHAGAIKKLLLVYTWTAELGVISVVDILKALPEAEALVISQFSPESEQFRIFTSILTREGLGRNAQGKPRIQFVQDASAYGPWPRDQALVDTAGTVWVSASDQHRLRSLFTSLDATYGIQRRNTEIPFAGANLLFCGNRILCPDRLDTTVLSDFLQGSYVSLPSPEPPAPFHLDLLVMPLSDKLVAVGDDALARPALLALTPDEQKRMLARWAAEYAVCAHNVELRQERGNLVFRRLDRPELILWPMLNEKLRIVTSLARPEAFREAVLAEPNYEWDDRIASSLTKSGFEVVRVPFWPGMAGTSQGKKVSGLPMMCYPNCLVWDEGILMPSYDLPALDELARARLEQASGKKVYLVRGGAILGYGNSGPHCLSLELRY